jgi:lactoylglutathione lyase
MTSCCYARSDKYWVTDPQGVAWEQFHTLGSIPTFGGTKEVAAACCAGVGGGCGTDAKPASAKAEPAKACC